MLVLMHVDEMYPIYYMREERDPEVEHPWGPPIDVPDDLVMEHRRIAAAFQHANRAVGAYLTAVTRDNRPEPEAARYKAELLRGRKRPHRRPHPKNRDPQHGNR